MLGICIISIVWISSALCGYTLWIYVSNATTIDIRAARAYTQSKAAATLRPNPGSADVGTGANDELAPICRGKAAVQGLLGQGGAWRPKANLAIADHPYSSRCPFIKNRYNCVGKNTSASDFSWSPSSNVCSVPNTTQWIRQVSQLPGNRTRLRVLLCGDSHLDQYFETILCTMQAHLTRLVLANGHPVSPPFRICSGQYEQENYYPKEYLANSSLPTDPGCTISHGPVNGQAQIARAYFDFGLELWFTFLRPAIKPSTRPGAGGQMCYGQAMRQARAQGHARDYFDAVVVNNYLRPTDIDHIRKAIKLDRARARLLIVPKFKLGGFTVLSPKPVVTPKPKPAKKGGDWLSFETLLDPRAADAMAVIYPFSFWDNATKQYKICQRAPEDVPSRCSGKLWHINTAGARGSPTHKPIPAQTTGKYRALHLLGQTPEGHFCMPGPLDEVVPLLLAAILPN